MSFIKNISNTFVAQSISSLLIFLVGIISARYLTVHDRGIYSLVFTTIGLLGTALSLGLGQANVYFHNKRKIPMSDIGSNCLCYTSLLIFILAVFWVVFYIASHYLQIASITPLLLSYILLGVIVFVLDVLVTGLVLGSHHYTLYTSNLLLQSGLIFVITSIVCYYHDDPSSFIVARLFALFLIVSFYIIRTSRKLKLGITKPDLSLLREQIKFGARSYLQNLVGLLNYRIYLYFLVMFANTASVGLMSVALLLMESLYLIPNAIGTVLLPKLTLYTKQSDADKFMLLSLKLLMPVIAVMVLVLFLITPELIGILFSNNYQPVVGVFRIMLLGGFFSSVYQLLSRYFTSRGLQKYSLYAGCTGLTITALFAWTLIPKYGIVAAGYCYVISGMILGASMLVFFKQVVGLSYREILLFDAEDRTVIKNLLNLAMYKIAIIRKGI